MVAPMMSPAKIKWWNAHPDYHKKWNKRAYRILRADVITKLGGKCVRCGFSDIRALQVDHVNGGGRQEINSTDTRTYLLRILENNSGKYQLLCANCNWIKRSENPNETGISVGLPKKET
jgi:hypothetical protein